VRICVIIPTYWTSSSSAINREAPSATYDHPTALESLSSLPRLFDSLKKTELPNESTTIFVIVAATHDVLKEKAAERTIRILKSYERYFDVRTFSASTLSRMKSEDKTLAMLLSLRGYSNVRNIGLIIAQTLESDIAYFLDDDVVVRDKKNFEKIQEFAGKRKGEKLLGGIAGYYVDQQGSFYLRVDPKEWWRAFWPKDAKMNAAFKIIEKPERLAETTFAFGGCMVVHWKMFEKVPFDPFVSRGEDMDLLVNARMFGYEFMLDTELKVVHIPSKGKTEWSEMRQDLFRFLYMRQKLLSHKNANRAMSVSIDSLKPYPGHFLLPQIPFNFATSSCLKSLHSIFQGDSKSSMEFMRNVRKIPSAIRFSGNHCRDYFDFQKRWANHVPNIRGSSSLKCVLRGRF
jgi:GT2 family glycosyltransferase